MIRFNELERIHVELSSACNAACPSCPRNVDGGYTAPWLTQRTMSTLDFKLIFDEETLLQIKSILMCGNYGDPIFCSDLPEILAYVSSINSTVDITVHTNGGIRSTDWWAKLAVSYQNLRVVFSIDGLEDTNHIYRRRVKWERVIENAAAFISAGGIAIWEFLIFEHNEHQIEQAQELSEKMGFSEIQFKRPFGFDSFDSSHQRMRVLDKTGAVEYYIYPPLETGFKNQNNKTTDRYQNDDGLPPTVFESTLEYKQHHIDDLIAADGHTLAHLDGTALNCMVKENKEIYIDSDGRLHPCCFLGIGGQPATIANDAIQYARWLEQNIADANDCKQHSVRQILDSNILTGISDSWDKSHADGRMQCCTRMCVKDTGLKERLYVNDAK